MFIPPHPALELTRLNAPRQHHIFSYYILLWTPWPIQMDLEYQPPIYDNLSPMSFSANGGPQPMRR